MEIFPGKTSWRSLRLLSGREPVSGELVRVVLDVTDMLVSPSSVVTEFCDVSSMCSDREFVEPRSFTFSKKRARCCTETQEEMRYEGSLCENASTFKKKHDAAYTCAKFAHLLCEGPRKVRSGRKKMECERKKKESSRGQNSFWKEATV